ncbi:MAG: response regulator transcription factor [Candidatus Omnitrophota bacterium]|nr:response regulator transcription factor [Candidatus Omnitrophota bacterium]
MPKKILIVDDEPNILKALESRLAHEKYAVVIASNGREGYEMAASEQPDLIIVDALMPEMTGYQLVDKLRERTDKMAKVPIIVISARPSIKKFFSIWKIHAFLEKPFGPEDLMARVRECLGDKK